MTDDEIFSYYRGRCVSCFSEPAVTLHEIAPKSKRPKDWMEFENRAPLCAGCHALAHENTVTASGWIRENRKRLVKLLYGDHPPPVRAP